MRLDPGFIPLKYNYKWQNFSQLTKELYRNVAEYQYHSIDGASEGTIWARQARFEFTLPMVYGDGLRIQEPYYSEL